MPTTMDYQKTVQALKRLRVETGSLACFGCGHEHNCSTQGCAILRNAVAHMEAALERATFTLPNEPLTLEQLRKMDGQPVYIIASDMGIAEWNVIAGKEWITVAYDVPCNGFKAVVECVGFINGRAFRIDSYGKDWFAYRRPQEGEA